MAVMAAVNARKYGSHDEPCGVAVPKKSITGICQHPHRTPRATAGPSAFGVLAILENAKPIQPISSKKPATTPKEAPTKNWFGANTGEAKVFKRRRTIKMVAGGISSAAYHGAPTRIRRIRKKRSRQPLVPS